MPGACGRARWVRRVGVVGVLGIGGPLKSRCFIRRICRYPRAISACLFQRCILRLDLGGARGRHASIAAGPQRSPSVQTLSYQLNLLSHGFQNLIDAALQALQSVRQNRNLQFGLCVEHRVVKSHTLQLGHQFFFCLSSDPAHERRQVQPQRISPGVAAETAKTILRSDRQAEILHSGFKPESPARFWRCSSPEIPGGRSHSTSVFET